MSLKTKETAASFGGKLIKQTHDAKTTGCEMEFNIYIPDSAGQGGKKVPLLIYLSGLTCTGDNCAQKGFYQHGASKRGIAVLYPDTSPRGLKLPGEDDSYDFGSGAGFYINATASPWSTNYKMYDYITSELPQVISDNYGSDKIDMSRVGICGHSMGGHGAISLFLKNPGMYKSCSAMAPISNPLKCPWGEKAFKGYFGEEEWEVKGKEYDSTELMKGWKGGELDILIDVGLEDNFYKQGQLLPENLVEAAKSISQPKGVTLREQAGHNHSYYTIATFADDHLDHHAKYLCSYASRIGKQKL